MLMTIALDSEQGPDGGNLSEIKREKVRETVAQEQRVGGGGLTNILFFQH